MNGDQEVKAVNQETRFLDMLLQAVMLMALKYEDQACFLPGFVCLPDEVISIFDEAYLLFDQVIDAGLVTEAQIAAIKTIDRFTQDMDSKKSSENIWTLEAMKTSPDWQQLRTLARDALHLFNVTDMKPNFDFLTFIPSKKDRDDDHSM